METLESIKLRQIDHIYRVQAKNNEDDDGEKHLASADYAMEAIGAVLDGIETRVVQMFLEADAG